MNHRFGVRGHILQAASQHTTRDIVRCITHFQSSRFRGTYNYIRSYQLMEYVLPHQIILALRCWCYGEHILTRWNHSYWKLQWSNTRQKISAVQYSSGAFARFNDDRALATVCLFPRASLWALGRFWCWGLVLGGIRWCQGVTYYRIRWPKGLSCVQALFRRLKWALV
jgi:hypothetical protein